MRSTCPVVPFSSTHSSALTKRSSRRSGPHRAADMALNPSQAVSRLLRRRRRPGCATPDRRGAQLRVSDQRAPSHVEYAQGQHRVHAAGRSGRVTCYRVHRPLSRRIPVVRRSATHRVRSGQSRPRWRGAAAACGHLRHAPSPRRSPALGAHRKPPRRTDQPICIVSPIAYVRTLTRVPLIAGSRVSHNAYSMARRKVSQNAADGGVCRRWETPGSDGAVVGQRTSCCDALRVSGGGLSCEDVIVGKEVLWDGLTGSMSSFRIRAPTMRL